MTVERRHSGRFHARCDAGPDGVVEAEADSSAAAVERVEKEIRYRLELCPCSRSAREYLELEVREVGGSGRPRASAASFSQRSSDGRAR